MDPATYRPVHHGLCSEHTEQGATTRWLCGSFPQRSFRVRGNPHLLAHPTTRSSFRCKFSSQEEKEFCVCVQSSWNWNWLHQRRPSFVFGQGNEPSLQETQGHSHIAQHCRAMQPTPQPPASASLFPSSCQLLHSQRSAGNHPRQNLPQGLLRARSRADLEQGPSDQLDKTLTEQSTIRRCGVTEALPLNCLHPFPGPWGHSNNPSDSGHMQLPIPRSLPCFLLRSPPLSWLTSFYPYSFNNLGCKWPYAVPDFPLAVTLVSYFKLLRESVWHSNPFSSQGLMGPLTRERKTLQVLADLISASSHPLFFLLVKLVFLWDIQMATTPSQSLPDAVAYNITSGLNLPRFVRQRKTLSLPTCHKYVPTGFGAGYGVSYGFRSLCVSIYLFQTRASQT